ncbi:MAG: c-type cytochrome [Vicinamibacteraceae bacterium]
MLGLRVARLHGADMLTLSEPLLSDASPQVRREIALLLQDSSRMRPPYLVGEQVQPSQPWLDAVTRLVERYDGEDRWYLEALGIAARGREDALYARLKRDNAGKLSAPLNRVVWRLRPQSALPDLVAAVNDASRSMEERELALDTIGAMQWPEAARAMERFITASSSPPALVERAFGLYSHQLSSLWMDARTSPALSSVMRKGFALPGAQSAAVSVVDELKDPAYVPELLALAKSEAATAEARAAALESDVMEAPQHLDDLRALAERGPTPVRVAAVSAIANLAPPNIEPWTKKIVLGDAPNEVRTSALRLLGESVAGLTAILDMAEGGTLPPELRTLARNLTNHAGERRGRRRQNTQSPVALRQAGRDGSVEPNFLAVRERAAKVLPMPAAKRIPTSFELDLSYRGVPADGRKWFASDAGCAACHSLGGKDALGPDLSAIGAKYDKQAMLDHIVNPNDAIGPEYITTMFTLQNGEQVLGLVTDETADRIVVQIGAGQQRALPASDVASRQQSQVSSMPEGLLDNLSLQQIADLLEFLSTLK